MKKPIALLLTDTHLKVENILLVKSIFQQFIDLAKKLNITYLVFKGDFFNSRASQGLDCLFAASEIFHMFEENDLVLNCISGNHDKASLVEPISYLSVTKRNPKFVKIFEKPYFEYDVNLKVVYCYLSYFKEGICYLNHLVDLIEMIKADKKAMSYKKVLFTHISINGVKNNDNSLVEGDMELGYFDFFDLVTSGHYHNRQSLSDQVIYTGSAYQANYGEDAKKGFTVLYDDLSIKQIKSKFPEYKKLYVDASDKQAATELLEQYQDTEDNVRFIFKGTPAELEEVNPLKYNTKNIDVKFENVDMDRDFEELETAEFVKFTKSSISKYWMEYCVDNNIEQEQKIKGMKLLTLTK